jgi:GxxExxY protein
MEGEPRAADRAPSRAVNLECGDITKQIIGAAYEVHRVLSYGFLEKVYQKALQVELIARGLKAEREYKIKLLYKGVVVDDYQADLLVEDRVIVELKFAESYNSADEAQLLNELKASRIKVGLLLSFGRRKVEHRRFVY